MSTRGEVRHRWTPAERVRLLEQSKHYETVGEAAAALYLDFGVTLRALARQLYLFAVRGKAPWLSTRAARGPSSFPTRWMLFTTRQLADAMRQAGADEALVSVARDGTVTALFTRGRETETEVLP